MPLLKDAILEVRSALETTGLNPPSMLGTALELERQPLPLHQVFQPT